MYTPSSIYFHGIIQLSIQKLYFDRFSGFSAELKIVTDKGILYLVKFFFLLCLSFVTLFFPTIVASKDEYTTTTIFPSLAGIVRSRRSRLIYSDRRKHVAVSRVIRSSLS